MCVWWTGDVQAALLRSEPQLHLLGGHPHRHLARALPGHQSPDAEPAFRADADGARRRGDRRLDDQRP